MTDKPRAGDTNTRKFFRSNRISVSNGQFFFSTREGTLEGPFESRDDAERELMMYIRRASGNDIFGSIIRPDPPK